MLNKRGLTAAQIASSKGFNALATLLQSAHENGDENFVRNELHGIQLSQSLDNLAKITPSAPSLNKNARSATANSSVWRTEREQALNDDLSSLTEIASLATATTKRTPILKLGGLFGRSWQVRELLLDASERTLSYFKRGRPRPQGVMSLDGARVQIIEGPEPNGGGSGSSGVGGVDTKKLFRFAVYPDTATTHKKCYHFATETERLGQEWVKLLRDLTKPDS